jgi:hypothetical protein
VQEVDFPSVTLCNPHGQDSGKYVRAIFNNFVFLEIETTKDGSAKLKTLFKDFLDDVIDTFNTHTLGDDFYE